MTFDIGPANLQDAVSGGTITLPAGKYTDLFMLGAMVNNIPPAETFTVTYTDGTTTVLNQNMSDWFNAAGWPGESVVNCSEKRNFDDGTSQPDSVCVYGYDIPLDDTKTVKSVTLPNTRNIVMLSMDLATPQVPGTFVYNPPAGTIEPVGTDTLSVTFTPTDTTDYTTRHRHRAAGGDKPGHAHRYADDLVADTGTDHLRYAFELRPTQCGSHGRAQAHAGYPHQSVAGDCHLYRRYSIQPAGLRQCRRNLLVQSAEQRFSGLRGYDLHPRAANGSQRDHQWSGVHPTGAGQLFHSLPDWRRDHHRADQPALRSQLFDREPGDPDDQHELVGSIRGLCG